MFCNKCKVDVHPAKILGTVSAGKDMEGVIPGAFFNQCPLCQCPMPDDAPVIEMPKAERPLMPMGGLLRPQQAAAPKRAGSLIDSARAELADADASIAKMQARIAELKTEITLAKSHRAGLLRVVAAYERGVRGVAVKAAAEADDIRSH